MNNIKKLKKQQKVSINWTKKELNYLKRLKKSGIYPSTITKDAWTMQTFFPNRTKISILTQYHRI